MSAESRAAPAERYGAPSCPGHGAHCSPLVTLPSALIPRHSAPVIQHSSLMAWHLMVSTLSRPHMEVKV